MQKRPVTAEDLFALQVPGDVQVRPGGGALAFVVRSINAETNEYEHRIWCADMSGDEPAEPKQLTEGPTDTHPRWSPDGQRLAFLSRRSGSSQVWVLAPDSGELLQLTDGDDAVQEFAWSPDGTRLAVVFQVRDADADESPLARHTRGVRVLTRVWYKTDGRGFLDPDTHRQIAVVPLDGGEPWHVTSGPYEHRSPVWSPDGERIAFVANRRDDWDYYPRHKDVWVVPAARPTGAPADPVRVTGGDVDASLPTWLPDGQRVCYVGSDPELHGADNPRLYVVSVPRSDTTGAPGDGAGSDGGPPGAPTVHGLAAAWDRPVGNRALSDVTGPTSARPVWADDGVYMLGSDGGTTQLYRFPADGGAPVRITDEEWVVTDFALLPGGQGAVVVASDHVHPPEIFRVTAGRAPESVTRLNDAWVQSVALAEAERYTFAAVGGPAVDGWVMLPPAAKPAAKVPAVLQIHGGPMRMYGAAFFFEFQLLAAHGYAVIFTNPRGSHGYGEAFSLAIRGKWGSGDYDDLMAGVDAALARFPSLDAERLGIAGGSYGGFMVTWTICHTDRFRAAVSSRAVSNRLSAMGTADFGFNRVSQIGPRLWDDPAPYLQQSPLMYVANCRTPLLIEHAENDYRCPIEQAEQLYAALKVLRRPVTFVRYPGESHGMTTSGKPWHRVHRLRLIVDWFAEHLGDGSGAAGSKADAAPAPTE